MAVSIPPQRHRCPVHDWCTVPGLVHHLHVGGANTLTTSRGIEIRVSLTAEEHQAPAVQLEAAFDRGSPMMEVGELAVADAVQLADSLLRLAKLAHVANRIR